MSGEHGNQSNHSDEEDLRTAQALLNQGRNEHAREPLHAILSRNPHHAAANNLMGFIALKKGDPDEAQPWFERAGQAAPDNPTYRDNIATARALKQQWTDATALRSTLAANPQQPELWRKLAQAEAAARRVDAAIAALYEGLSHCPEHPALLHALGNYLHHAGRLAQAATHYHHCLRVAPQMAEAHIDLSMVYLRLLDANRAEAAARAAVTCAPDSVRALGQLASVLYQRNRFGEALAALDQAQTLASQDAHVSHLAAMVHAALGDNARAIECYRRAVALNPGNPVIHSNLLLALLYSDTVSGADIHRQACAYARRFARADAVPHDNERNPARRLRVGFVSGDFRRHVVGLFLLPLFEHYDRARSEYFCYSLIDAPDPFTQILAGRAAHWLDIRGMDDAQLAARVRADGIDILVDLTGHTSDNRLRAFAQRPAPVQVTWLGYPGTTGAPGIDYRFTDAVLDPPGSEALSTEQLVRMENGFFCYRPPPEWGGLLPVAALPAHARGHVTFGAFNNLAKVSPACLDAWARILAQTPASRLVCRAKPFDHAEQRSRFVEQFAQRGIDAARIEPLPYLPDPARHLVAYHEVDIHLDSLPYTGGTTTCDALWMGVPVVTLCGDRPSARLGACVLERVGLRELVASNAGDYVRLAVELACDLPRLASLRQSMRTRFTGSPLHDAPGFARTFDAACRAVWREWCMRTD